MRTPLQIDVITIFPEMLDGFLGASMMKRAAQMGAVKFRAVNLRDYTRDVHRTTDDRPFGGGPGMVLKCEPIFAAVEALQAPGARVLLMTPQGRPFAQATAQRLAQEQHLIFVCGHYEGVDERIRQTLVDEEISIGDYVLTNGVLPAAVPTPDPPPSCRLLKTSVPPCRGTRAELSKLLTQFLLPKLICY